jgi:hypothetical protein
MQHCKSEELSWCYIKVIFLVCTSFKGTHARDFIMCFYTFLKIFQSLIDTKRSTANIFEHILKIRPDIQSFRSLVVFAESAKQG